MMIRSFWLPLAVLSLAGVSASAVPMVFSGIDLGASSRDVHAQSDQAAADFDASMSTLGEHHMVDFEASPTGSFQTLMAVPGIAFRGPSRRGSQGEIRDTPRGLREQLFGYNTTADGSHFASFVGGIIVIEFSTPINAFGGYFSGVQLSDVTISYTDDSSQMLPIPGATVGGVQFFGFQDMDRAISSITINAGHDVIGLDDVRFAMLAPTDPVPDQGSMCLMLMLASAGCALLNRSTFFACGR